MNHVEVFNFLRIFFDDLPWFYLGEIAFRTAFMFIFILIIMRFAGKRSVHQLTLYELVILLALSSAAGDPMFYTDVPVLWGVTVLFIVVLLYRALTLVISNSKLVENITQGKPTRIIKDGLIEHRNLESQTLSPREMMMLLRAQGIKNVGEVERAYLERSGSLGVYRFSKKQQKPGLSTAPEGSEDFPKVYNCGQKVLHGDFYACMKTGETKYLKKGSRFPKCPGDKWAQAVSPSQD